MCQEIDSPIGDSVSRRIGPTSAVAVGREEYMDREHVLTRRRQCRVVQAGHTYFEYRNL